ncbi:MAG TPA: nickel pincer cofactor biosynthesis protein LarC [Verrucomicrobiae bacterium]|nr:nickel pincer cofactor biosynthesis protein LarC [Verrucomicrobiae bacterium]
MRLAYFDCPSGAAGDMILGALVDAGLPFDDLRAGLERLALPGYTLEQRQVMKRGFRATKVEVHLHEHAHRGHEHHHPHRTLPAIRELIQTSTLPDPVKGSAVRVFTRLAEAEGRAHGQAPEAVHFHDVGAVDAIVDITGACLGLHLLGVGAVHCSALPVGGGMVDGPHGRIPVPGPGTAELLRGFPVVDTGVKRELVTPTGAAILTTLAQGAGAMPPMTVSAVGYGAGTMELETPNLIRVFLGDSAAAGATETVMQVETTVDDMSPQLYEALMERLFAAGALDVYLTQVIMKRSRPGIVLVALCPPGLAPDLARILFEESTTIGVRWTAYERARLPREMVTLGTSLGPLTFKVSRLEGRPVTVTPEFEEVRRIARDKGLPVREALERAREEGRRLLG